MGLLVYGVAGSLLDSDSNYVMFQTLKHAIRCIMKGHTHMTPHIRCFNNNQPSSGSQVCLRLSIDGIALTIGCIYPRLVYVYQPVHHAGSPASRCIICPRTQNPLRRVTINKNNTDQIILVALQATNLAYVS